MAQLSECALPPGTYLISPLQDSTKTVIVEGDSTVSGARLILANTTDALLNNPSRNWLLANAGGYCILTNDNSKLVLTANTTTNAANYAIQTRIPGCENVKLWYLVPSSGNLGSFRLPAIAPTGAIGNLKLDGNNNIVVGLWGSDPEPAWKFTPVGGPPL